MTWKNVLKEEELPQKPIPKKKSKANTPWGVDANRKKILEAKREKAKRQKKTDETSQLDLYGNVIKAKKKIPDGWTKTAWNTLKLDYLAFSNEAEMLEVIKDIREENKFKSAITLLNRLKNSAQQKQEIENTVQFSKRLSFDEMISRGAKLLDALTIVKATDVEKYITELLDGKPEALLEFLDNIPRETQRDRMKKIRTWVENHFTMSESDNSRITMRQRVVEHLEKNPELKQTNIGKTFKVFEKYGEESKISSWKDIPNNIAINYFRFILTSNKISSANKRELLPKSYESMDNQTTDFDEFFVSGRPREIPAISYILNNEQFGFGENDFQTQSSNTVNRSRAIDKLKREYLTAYERKGDPRKKIKPKKGKTPLNDAFDAYVEVQQGSQLDDENYVAPPNENKPRHRGKQTITVGEGDTARTTTTLGRTRNLGKFFEMLENPDPAKGQTGLAEQWKKLVASMGTNPRYSISTGAWEALVRMAKLDEQSEKMDEEKFQEEVVEAGEGIMSYLPIGALSTLEQVEGELQDDDLVGGFIDEEGVKEALYRMKPSNDKETMKPGTMEDVKTLERLFIGSGSARGLIDAKFKTRKEREKLNVEDEGVFYDFLTDGEFSQSIIKPEDVIEMLLIMEEKFMGGEYWTQGDSSEGSIEDVVDELSGAVSIQDEKEHNQEWDKWMDKLFEVLKSDQYKNIRQSFINAIRVAMFKESKAVDSPAKKWIDEQSIDEA